MIAATIREDPALSRADLVARKARVDRSEAVIDIDYWGDTLCTNGPATDGNRSAARLSNYPSSAPVRRHAASLFEQ